MTKPTLPLAKKRCFGGPDDEDFYARYHDFEWGVPVYDDNRLFELLVLEGMQAGLNWRLILQRRAEYRNVFHDFDPVKVSRMSDAELDALMHNPKIIRNRRKIASARHNARVFLAVQKEFGSFSRYLWGFVGGKPVENNPRGPSEPVCTSPEGDLLAKDLRKRGMTFVGPKIIYSYMQAVGLVNDHLADCWIRAGS
jgi:DNA-3-methyladenine glycosylase I